jgi:hypothetical protein
MGWYTMPATVQETAFERQIKEGKAYQLSVEFTIEPETSQWVYITLPENKDVILQSRSISATGGPIKYKVFPGATLVGPLGDPLMPEKLNTAKNGPALTQFWTVDEANVDVTGIDPKDRQLVVATQSSPNRGVGALLFQNFFKVYKGGAGVNIAVSLENFATAASVDALVELTFIWAEDVE